MGWKGVDLDLTRRKPPWSVRLTLHPGPESKCATPDNPRMDYTVGAQEEHDQTKWPDSCGIMHSPHNPIDIRLNGRSMMWVQNDERQLPAREIPLMEQVSIPGESLERSENRLSLGKPYRLSQFLTGFGQASAATVVPDNERWLLQPRPIADLENTLAWAQADAPFDGNPRSENPGLIPRVSQLRLCPSHLCRG
jgi:hypothetical protein